MEGGAAKQWRAGNIAIENLEQVMSRGSSEGVETLKEAARGLARGRRLAQRSSRDSCSSPAAVMTARTRLVAEKTERKQRCMRDVCNKTHHPWA